MVLVEKRIYSWVILKCRNLLKQYQNNKNGISKQWEKNYYLTGSVATSGKIFGKQEYLNLGFIPCTKISYKPQGEPFLEYISNSRQAGYVVPGLLPSR